MKIININGFQVKISDKVYSRIERTAKERNLSFAEAILFFVKKVI